jgi:hypothetical protein
MASNNACKSIQQGYKAKFGLVTSNFYKVNQFLVGDNDSITILKPYYTQVEFSDCYPEREDNNLLVVYNAKNNKTKIYDNLLFSDDRNVLQELKTNGKGFAIHSEQGNSSKLFTNVFISKNIIDSIQIESWGINQYSKTYKFKNFSLDKFQIKLLIFYSKSWISKIIFYDGFQMLSFTKWQGFGKENFVLSRENKCEIKYSLLWVG